MSKVLERLWEECTLDKVDRYWQIAMHGVLVAWNGIKMRCSNTFIWLLKYICYIHYWILQNASEVLKKNTSFSDAVS